MIEVRIENKVFELPSDWEEVTFKRFIGLTSIQEDGMNSELEIFVKALTALSGDKSFSNYLNKMSIDDFNTLKDYFNWIAEDFDSQKYKSETNIFEIHGEKWKLKDNFNKLSVGEMVSLELMLKDKKMDLSPYEIAFGILFRRVDDQGNEVAFNVDDMIKIILNYSDEIYVTDVISKLDFFLSGENASTTKSSAVSFQVLEKKTSTLGCQTKKLPNTRQKKKKN